jgi:hypothetical protein
VADDLLEVPEEINIVGGVEVSVAPRVGISADIVARQLRGVHQFEGLPGTFASRGPSVTPLAVSVPSDLTAIGPGNLTQILAGFGTRVHIGRPLLLSFDLLLPVSGDGLLPKAVAVAGFSMAF